MKRFITLFWVVLLAVAAYGVYGIKYRVEAVKERVASLEQELASEQEALTMQQAEWSRLNNPKRLRTLAKGRIAMQPVPAAAIIDISALNLRESSMRFARVGDDAR